MTTPLCDLHCKKPAQYRVSVKSKHYNTTHVSYLCEKHTVAMVTNNLFYYDSITIENLSSVTSTK